MPPGPDMLMSYAQRLEDYYLARAFQGQAIGCYVDIGGGHPIEDNVSYWFYRQGWRGLVVEPQQALLSAYCNVRPGDALDDSLVGDRNGETDFHMFATLHGLSTIKAANAEAATEYEPTYATIRKPIVTLATLLERHRVGVIDFLKVDVEGAELDVFAGADWRRWRPRAILAEAIAPGLAADAWRRWDAILVAQNYEFVLFDGLNRYYVAAEEQALKVAFPKEMADWGVVAHHEW